MDKDGLGSGPQALGSGPQALAGEGPRLVHQIAFATPTPPVTGMRRLHGNDLSVMNAFVGPLLAFGL